MDTTQLPTLSIKDGNLVFETGKDKTIAFQSTNGGTINVNDANLGNLVNDAKATSSRLESLTSTHITAIQDKITKLEQLLVSLSDSINGTQVIQESVKSVKEKIDGILGTGANALTPFRVRLALRRITRMQNDLNALKFSVSKNECKSNPCKNGGTCVDGYKTFYCRCTNGWRGDTCETDVDECSEFAGTGYGCQNGATCVNTPGSYSCQCKADWKGVHCAERHDDCTGASNRELCDHGTCVNVPRTKAGEAKYRCQCEQGWTNTGSNGDGPCSKDINECDQGPCSTNPFVPCYNLPGTFSCGSCPPGYTGSGFFCRDINECLVNNGGCSP
ncbi:cubilin-like protein, partial [Leptotrombidium deliense]